MGGPALDCHARSAAASGKTVGGEVMITCDCEVYEICPSCAPSEPAYAKAAEAHDRVVQEAVRNDQRRQLEHELSAAFIAQQRERIPTERARLWNECLRLVDEIERLNDA